MSDNNSQQKQVQFTDSQFHADEIAVQARLGIAEKVAHYSKGFIRDAMPEQHREFFCQLPMVVLGMVDHDGFPWALPLYGKPGFIQSPSDTQLTLEATPDLASLFALDVHHGQKIGLLGIELETRRRNRMNGTIREISSQSLAIEVEQSFGNCPQYIQTRAFNYNELESSAYQADPTGFEHLTLATNIAPSSKSLIESADTFFIASRTRDFNEDKRTGIDASHRGGKPGFVKVTGNSLSFPDFSGNKFFNTLGNITSDGRVGLYFPNYATGDAVFLTGQASIAWQHKALPDIKGAERIIEVTVEKSVFISGYLPVTGELVENSPALDNTGTWLKQAATPSVTSETAPNMSNVLNTQNNAFSPFVITKKQRESSTITSFYFAPRDIKSQNPEKVRTDIKRTHKESTEKVSTDKASTEKAASSYQAGQFIPIKIALPNSQKTAQRSYTLSQAQTSSLSQAHTGATNNHYRISVKREPQGLVSKALHDHYQVGDTVWLGQPAGNFTLKTSDKPIVLLSSGVGITPMIAMLQGQINLLKEQSANVIKPRPVWFIHGSQNSDTQAFNAYLKTLSAQHQWLNIKTFYSRPLKRHKLGQDYDIKGRISVTELRQILPDINCDYYLCGSEQFMRDLFAGLIKLGVEKTNISYEFFGAGSIEEPTQSQQPTHQTSHSALPEKSAKSAKVIFSSSQTSAQWTPNETSLLALAEAKGLNPMYSCRSGNCGACTCKLETGQVTYPQQPAYPVAEGEVLICCAQPAAGTKTLTLTL
ncbi:2Fe-2S iron-sulfur cluster-binding protein [Thalassotalea montiporae]